MFIGVILAHYRCNLLTLLFVTKLAAIHFYVDGLGFLGAFECFNDFFLYGHHTCHHLGKAVRQLIGFLGWKYDLSFAPLS